VDTCSQHERHYLPGNWRNGHRPWKISKEHPTHVQIRATHTQLQLIHHLQVPHIWWVLTWRTSGAHSNNTRYATRAMHMDALPPPEAATLLSGPMRYARLSESALTPPAEQIHAVGHTTWLLFDQTMREAFVPACRSHVLPSGPGFILSYVLRL
jgi:hypothetical protein